MREMISALMDGELAGASIDAALALLNQPEQFARYDAYHQIRHVLRAGAHGVDLSTDFASEMIARLRNSG